MGSEKTVMLVRRLFERTNGGELEWRQTDGAGFQVAFAGYSVTIDRRAARDEFGNNHDEFTLSILNADGRMVEQITTADLGETLPNPEKVMASLFEGARRRAMGVEQALDSILASLSPTVRDQTRSS